MAMYETMDVAALVDQATDPTLSEPAWEVNLTLCDLSSGNPSMCGDIIQSVHRKLQSSSPHILLLALILVETLVKNGSSSLHAQVASRSFLASIAALTDGSLGEQVQASSTRLIKQWADTFSSNPDLAAFHDVYHQLKMRGVSFPERADDAPVFTPPSDTATSMPPPAPIQQDSSTMQAGSAREQQLAKLHADLKVVLGKIERFRELRMIGSQDSDESEDLIDFLRQCQPRMNTLIEGGLSGKIDEQTLEKCLLVNDNLIKLLEDVGGVADPSVKTDDLLGLDRMHLQDSKPARAHSTTEQGELIPTPLPSRT